MATDLHRVVSMQIVYSKLTKCWIDTTVSFWKSKINLLLPDNSRSQFLSVQFPEGPTRLTC